VSAVSSSATAPDLPPGTPLQRGNPEVLAGSPVAGPDVLAGEWARATAAVDAAAEVCLACHVHPDADALGSMLAVAHALLERQTVGSHPTMSARRPRHGQPGEQPKPGQRILTSFGDDPPRVPDNLCFLPGLDLISSPRSYPAEPELMITFDAASSGRLGMLASNASRANELIVIDHHPSNTRFGTIHLVDPAAAATAVLACDLIDRLGLPLTRPVALGLYAGLVTDTGSFKHASTTVAVHQLAARLLATGIEPEAVARELWDRAPFGYLPVLARALGRAVLEPRHAGGRGLVWTAVSRADRQAHGLGYDQVEPVIDVVRRTADAEIAVVFKEDDGGRWHVSARSKGNVDVGRVCVELGGGGHRVAAGFTSRWPVEHAIQRLRELLADIGSGPADDGKPRPDGQSAADGKPTVADGGR